MCVQALVSDDDEDEELLSDSVNDEIPDEELSLPDEHPHSPDDSDNNDDSDNSANMWEWPSFWSFWQRLPRST